MWLTGHYAIPESLTLLPREVDDFLRGGNHSKHMPPLTYLAWLQPIYYNSMVVFIHINITKSFTCDENFNKKYYFSSGSVFLKKIFQVQFLKNFFFQVQFLNFILFYFFFFRFSFWKKFFSGLVFENIFFQVQFLKIFFFLGSVFENKIVKQISNHTNQSATLKTWAIIKSKIIAPSKNTF